MEDNKSPLKRWFRQLVTLEEIRSSEQAAAHPPILPPEDIPPVYEVPAHNFKEHLRLYLLAASSSLVFLVAMWFVSSIYFTKIQLGTHSFAATISDSELKQKLNGQLSEYRLTIKRPDQVSKQYSIQEMGYKLNQTKTLQQIRDQQHSLKQRLKWWQPIKAKLVLNTDQTLNKTFIAQEINLTIQPSQDAVLSFENGEIKVTDAVAGKQYGLTSPAQELKAAASTLASKPVQLRTLTLNPALTAEILEPYKENLDKALHQSITFRIGNRQVKPSSSDIASWLEITPDTKSKKVDISVNSGKVLEYIDRIAAQDIRPPKAQIEVKKPDGSTRVLVAGINGLDVVNKKESATSIASNLLSGEGIDMALNVSYQAFKIITTDSYEKWIEVDLTNKRLYAYERDNLVKTYLVTAGAPDTPTVTGQYAIYTKYAVQDMRGNNVDGSRYYQPNVKWVSYFYRDYAIHGNYWRPTSYFGNVNSSHGCVSLVENEAEWVYNWAPIGTPVIVHT